MQNKYEKSLLKVNKDFYEVAGEEFSMTRNDSWKGWEKVWDSQTDTKNVLDLGCGNGRFLKFLVENGYKGRYVGVDQEQILLKEVGKIKSENVEVIQADLLANWNVKLKDKFDFIALFAVLHHIPSIDLCCEIILKAKSLLDDNGVIAISVWQFLNSPRLKKKFVETSSKLKENDYFISWGVGSEKYRYCHNFQSDEIIDLAKKAGLQIVKEFESDGREGNLNRYVLLKKLVTSI